MRRRDVVAMIAASALTTAAVRPRPLRPAGRGYVLVDPRIELMSVVHLLGGYFLATQVKSAYRDEALAFFSAHRAHPAVAMAKALATESLAFDAVPDLVLRLTAPPELVRRADLAADPIRGIPDDRRREDFLAALRDFWRVSDFGTFFDGHRRLYRRFADQITPGVNPNVEALQAYVGAGLNRWQVIAAPLMHDGGFGPRLRRRDGEMETYALIGPDGARGGVPGFGDAARLQDLVVHEFAHSLVNPLAEREPAIVAGYVSRFADLRAAMEKEGYGDWPTVVNEHVVRAVTARVIARSGGDDAGQAAVAAELKRGFVYLPALVRQLKLYEADRRRWPSLGSFYPVLLEAFGRLPPA